MFETTPRLKRWLRHTSSVPKGFLRYYMLRLLKEKPLSGSEIMEECKKETRGRWKPSPGSVYPQLAWLQDKGYIKEIPTEELGMKRYVLMEQGKKLFHEKTKFLQKLDKRLTFILPLQFLPEKLRKLREPARRLFSALLSLRSLEEKMTEQDLKEVEQILESTAEKMEKINRKLKGGK